MVMKFDRLVATRKTGAELFHRDGRPVGFDLLSFWQWSTSDLVSNATRGILAEYLVAQAVAAGGSGVREEWAAFDLETPSGVRIEVKSAAYLQTWAHAKLSTISFSVRPTRAWDPKTNQMASEPCRHADVYVFALLAHKDKATIEPLNLAQWRFYVLPQAVLNARARSQHSITLKSLQDLAGGSVPFEGLREAIEQAAVRNRELAV